LETVYRIFLLSLILVQLFYQKLEIILLSSSLALLFSMLGRTLQLSKKVIGLLSVLAIIALYGLLLGVIKGYILYDIIRDTVHYLKPIIVVLSGYFLTQKLRNNTQFVLKSIIYIALFMAVRHIIIVASLDVVDFDIEQIRKKAGALGFVELLALLVLIFREKLGVLKKPSHKYIFYPTLIILSVSFLLYFSRTMILMLVLFFISIKGYTRISLTAAKKILFTIGLIGLFYIYLFSIDLEPDSKGVSRLLVKLKNAPAEVFKSPGSYHPDKHAEIFKHWRAYEASAAINQMDSYSDFVLGKGFGALIDLKFKAPVGGENGLRYITYLHNGYIYIFYKTGIMGLLLYLFFLIKLYAYIHYKKIDWDRVLYLRLVSGFALYFIFGSFIITGFYNIEDISVLFLGIFLSLSTGTSNAVVNRERWK